MPEVLVQHVGHHAEHVRKTAVLDLVFEIDDGYRTKTVLDTEAALTTGSACAPIRRSSAGMIVGLDVDARGT